jgi:hypothetical protein
MIWRHHGGGKQGVEILGPVLAALAMGTVRTTDRVGAMVFGAVPCDQHVAIEDPHSIQAATMVQLGHDIGEHRVEQGRFDRVEHGADLAVAGDLAHAEQCLTIRPAVTCLQMALVCQEGRALHEERNEVGEREVGHGVGRVPASPPVGQGLVAAAQRGDEAFLDLHTHVESGGFCEVARHRQRGVHGARPH